MPVFQTPPLDSARELFLAIDAVRRQPPIGSDSFSRMQRRMSNPETRRYVASGFDDEFSRQFDRHFPRNQH